MGYRMTPHLIDWLIGRWHDGKRLKDPDQPLHHYLGWTWEQYAHWATTMQIPTTKEEGSVGTRGAMGFVLDGKEYITYNHFDSYPSALGNDTREWLEAFFKDGGTVPQLREEVAALRLVNEGDKPTDEEVERFKAWGDRRVGEGFNTWYGLLRHTQGSIGGIIASGVMIDSAEFPTDSLFCEWVYMIDLDAEEFQVFEGFQKQPHTIGRFSTREPNPAGHHRQYYPVAQVAQWPLADLPSKETFLAVFAEENDD